MSRRKVRILRTVVFLAVAVVLVYYVYFSGHLPPVILQRLSTPYSFSQLLALAIAILGKPTVFALAVSFIALAAFFTSLPSSGGFSSLSPRAAGLFLVNEILALLTAVLILIGLRVFVSFLLDTLVLYLPLVVVSLLCVSTFSSDLSYSDYESSALGSLKGIVQTIFVRRLLVTHLLVLLAMGEILYFFNSNPTLPFLGWFFLGYAIMGALLTGAQGEGYAFQLTNARYVEVTPVDGANFTGYLASKGSDHYIFVTKDKTFLAPSESIKEIRIVKRPDKKAPPE